MDIFHPVFPESINPVYVLALTSIVLLYLIAFFGSRFWLTAKRRAKRVRKVLIPPQPSSIAYRAADERRSKILAVLAEFENSDYPKTEFIEVPPEISTSLRDDRPETNLEEDINSYWWRARLRMQLSETHYLLTERVTDLIVAMFRAGKIKKDQYPSLIFVERLEGHAHDDLFPWQVVIETRFPEAITNWVQLPQVRNWVGIGIQLSVPGGGASSRGGRSDQVDLSKLFPQGKCTVGSDGLEGTVGGVFKFPYGEVLGVTCRHVLSSGCLSRVWPIMPEPRPDFDEKLPDVALIHSSAKCFTVKNAKPKRVSTANAGQIDAAVKAYTVMRKSSSDDKHDGIIRIGYISNFTLDDSFYRGHHFSVELDFKNVLGIIVPLGRHYSKPGDSGAWILDENFEHWFGIVIGGFTSPGIQTIALSAELIVKVYEEYCKDTSSATTFIYPEAYLN